MDKLFTSIYTITGLVKDYIDVIEDSNANYLSQDKYLNIRLYIEYINTHKNKLTKYHNISIQSVTELNNDDFIRYIIKYSNTLLKACSYVEYMNTNIAAFNIYNESKVSDNIKQVSLQLTIQINIAYRSFRHEKQYIRKYLQQLFVQANYKFDVSHIEKLNTHHETIFVILNVLYHYINKGADLALNKSNTKIIRHHMHQYKNRYIDNAVKLHIHPCSWSYLLTRNKLVTIAREVDTVEHQSRIRYTHNIDIDYNIDQLFNINRQAKYQGINSYNSAVYNVIHYKPSTAMKYINFEDHRDMSKVDITIKNINDNTTRYLAPWRNDVREVPSDRVNSSINVIAKKYNTMFTHAVQQAPLFSDENRVVTIDYIDEVIRLQNEIYNIIENGRIDELNDAIYNNVEAMTSKITVKSRFKAYFTAYKKYTVRKIYDDVSMLMTMKKTNKIDDIYANIKLILSKNDNIISVLLNYNGYTSQTGSGSTRKSR